ncbi:hypothetical protein D049_1729A, partial [Vibrio parahaemolyticus VPTS-2010]
MLWRPPISVIAPSTF